MKLALLALCLMVIPALAYWLIVHTLHIHDIITREIIATAVSLGGVALAVSRLG